jgi:hypothetical protein
MSDKDALQTLLMRVSLSTHGTQSGLADFLRDPRTAMEGLSFSDQFLAGRDVRALVVEEILDRPDMHYLFDRGGPGMPFSENDKQLIEGAIDSVFDDRYRNDSRSPAAVFGDMLKQNEDLARSGVEGPAFERSIAAMTRFFDAHGQQLIEHYSNSAGPESETLARLYALTTLNPKAAGIDVGQGKTVADVVNSETGEALREYFRQAVEAKDEIPPDVGLRETALRHVAHIDAAVTAGTGLAFDRYEEQVARDAESKAAFARLATDLIGEIPVVGKATELPGFNEVLGYVSSAVSPTADNPAPEVMFARKFHDELGKRVEAVEGLWNEAGIWDRWSSAVDAEIKRSGTSIELDRKYLGLAAVQTTDGQERQYAALDGRLLIDNPLHSQNERFAGCVAACDRANLGLNPSATINVAAALTAQSMTDGVPRVDTVVQNRDATLLIGVMGHVEDPASRRTVLPMDLAMHQTVETSTQKIDALLEEQNRKAALQPPAPEREHAPRSVMV